MNLQASKGEVVFEKYLKNAPKYSKNMLLNLHLGTSSFKEGQEFLLPF